MQMQRDMLRTTTARRTTLRGVCIVVHRWVGLAIATFLVVAGVTGTLLVFYEALYEALDPSRAALADRPSDAPVLGSGALRDALRRQDPTVHAEYMPLAIAANRAVAVYVGAAPGAPEPVHDEYFLDPTSGEVIASRKWGVLPTRASELMPFVFRLHYSLALDEVGSLLMGIVALLWTLDCFVGAYLTFPAASRRGSSPVAWLRRWWPAWTIKTGKLASLVLTWHRASGLWPWAMLFVLAWSSVGLNLRSVYEPVMSSVRATRDLEAELPQRDEPLPEPPLGWSDAEREGAAIVDALAQARGFTVIERHSLGYDAAHGVYRYRVKSSLDVSDRHPATIVYVDATTGDLVAFEPPTGPGGDTATTWLFALHWGAVIGWGLPYRVFVSAMGLVVAALAGTGIWIWWRKLVLRRNARREAET